MSVRTSLSHTTIHTPGFRLLQKTLFLPNLNDIKPQTRKIDTHTRLKNYWLPLSPLEEYGSRDRYILILTVLWNNNSIHGLQLKKKLREFGNMGYGYCGYGHLVRFCISRPFPLLLGRTQTNIKRTTYLTHWFKYYLFINIKSRLKNYSDT